MDPEALKILIGSLGGGGVTVAAAWVMFKSYTGAIDKKDQVFEARIAALEKSAEECGHDRNRLHQQIFELQREQVGVVNSVIEKNSQVLAKTVQILETISPE